jgi:hypothetical protein
MEDPHLEHCMSGLYLTGICRNLRYGPFDNFRDRLLPWNFFFLINKLIFSTE